MSSPLLPSPPFVHTACNVASGRSHQSRPWPRISMKPVAGSVGATSSDASRAKGHCMLLSLKRTDPSKGTPTCPAAFPAPSASTATGDEKAGSDEPVATA